MPRAETVDIAELRNRTLDFFAGRIPKAFDAKRRVDDIVGICRHLLIQVHDYSEGRDAHHEGDEPDNNPFSRIPISHHFASEFRISQPCFSFSSVVA